VMLTGGGGGGAVTGRELPKQIDTESLSLPRDMTFLHFAAGFVEIIASLRLQTADEILVIGRGKHTCQDVTCQSEQQHW
jgi:hypothetical protein